MGLRGSEVLDCSPQTKVRSERRGAAMETAVPCGEGCWCRADLRLDFDVRPSAYSCMENCESRPACLPACLPTCTWDNDGFIILSVGEPRYQDSLLFLIAYNGPAQNSKPVLLLYTPRLPVPQPGVFIMQLRLRIMAENSECLAFRVSARIIPPASCERP